MYSPSAYLKISSSTFEVEELKRACALIISLNQLCRIENSPSYMYRICIPIFHATDFHLLWWDKEITVCIDLYLLFFICKVQGNYCKSGLQVTWLLFSCLCWFILFSCGLIANVLRPCTSPAQGLGTTSLMIIWCIRRVNVLIQNELLCVMIGVFKGHVTHFWLHTQYIQCWFGSACGIY